MAITLLILILVAATIGLSVVVIVLRNIQHHLHVLQVQQAEYFQTIYDARNSLEKKYLRKRSSYDN